MLGVRCRPETLIFIEPCLPAGVGDVVVMSVKLCETVHLPDQICPCGVLEASAEVTVHAHCGLILFLGQNARVEKNVDFSRTTQNIHTFSVKKEQKTLLPVVP